MLLECINNLFEAYHVNSMFHSLQSTLENVARMQNTIACKPLWWLLSVRIFNSHEIATALLVAGTNCFIIWDI